MEDQNDLGKLLSLMVGRIREGEAEIAALKALLVRNGAVTEEDLAFWLTAAQSKQGPQAGDEKDKMADLLGRFRGTVQ